MVKRDEEGLYIMIKESIHQKDMAIINIYVPTIRASKDDQKK